MTLRDILDELRRRLANPTSSGRTAAAQVKSSGNGTVPKKPRKKK